MAAGCEGDFLRRFGPYTDFTVAELGSAHSFSNKVREICKAKEYTGIDMQASKTVDIVHNMNTLPPIAPVDVVICFSMLEHCDKPWLVTANIEKILKPQGLLILSVPFQWRIHAYPNDYFRFTPNGIKSLFTEMDFFVEETDPPKAKLDSHVNGHVMLLMAGRKR